MNVDVSPNGKTLIFDLLGIIYTLPLTGGKAEPLLKPHSYWDRCPRFSPDGREIALISDRPPSDGVDVDNVWVLDLQTRQLRQVTSSREQIPPRSTLTMGVTGTPTWLSQGRELAFSTPTFNSRVLISRASAKFSERSKARLLETGFPLDPDPELRSAMWVMVHSASMAPEGNTAYFSESHYLSYVTATARPQATTQLYRLNLSTQQRKLMTEAVTDRDEFKPQVSRSGRFLAYARRDGLGDAELRVQDLRFGTDRLLTRIVADDPIRVGDYGDEIPAYAFTPDDDFIVIAYGGKLHRITVRDGTDVSIPFSARVHREVSLPVRARYHIPDGPVQIHSVRWPSTSPDLRKLVFSAAGYLWIVDLPNAKPKRLTLSNDFEYSPIVSPIGDRVAFISFPLRDDKIGVGPGHLMVLRIGDDQPHQVVSDEASYFVPSWSPDGKKLAVVRAVGAGNTATWTFAWIDVASGSVHDVAPAFPFTASAGNLTYADSYEQLISFSGDGTRLFFKRGGPTLHKVLTVATLDGSLEEVATVEGDTNCILPSPDLSHVLLIGPDQEGYIVQLPKNVSRPIRLSIAAGRRISEGGLEFPVWQSNNKLTYGWANRIFSYRAGDVTARPIANVDLELPRHQGDGLLAFRNARLITVAGKGNDNVIEHGTILVDGRRIRAIGTGDGVAVPAGTTVIDATGLTIMPGLIDTHYHYDTYNFTVTPAPRGELADPSTIAYGVTTIWDAMGSRGDGNSSRAEIRETGRSIGARWFAAGGALHDWIPAEKQTFSAMLAVAKKKYTLGAKQVLKDHGWPVRDQGQWYSEIARRLGVGIVAHAEGLTSLLKRASDGDSVDHASLSVPLYRDVKEFLGRTGVIWTPNISLSAGTSSPSTYDFLRSELEDLKALGPDQLDKFNRYAPALFKQQRQWESLPRVDYERTRAARVARAVADVLNSGGSISVSAHNAPAIMTHFEMWALQRGGVSASAAIRAATLTGAEKLGIQEDVGSLATGKIADFIVLTANPLERIQNSLAIKYTVSDGVIYDSRTLEEVWRKRSR